eukprot:g8091.t1
MPAASSDAGRRRVVLRVLSLAVALALLAVVLSQLPVADALTSTSRWLKAQGAAGDVVVVLIFALWIVAFLPSSPYELVIAAMYGLGHALVLITAGKLMGCVAAFLLGRSCGRERVERWIARRDRRGSGSDGTSAADILRALEAAVAARGWRLVLPFQFAYLPIAIKNYGLAVCSDVSLWLFTWTLLVGEAPGTVATALVGESAGTAAGVAGGGGGGGGGANATDTGGGTGGGAASQARTAALVVGVAGLALCTWLVTKHVRAELQRQQGGAAPGAGVELNSGATSSRNSSRRGDRGDGDTDGSKRSLLLNAQLHAAVL